MQKDKQTWPEDACKFWRLEKNVLTWQTEMEFWGFGRLERADCKKYDYELEKLEVRLSV